MVSTYNASVLSSRSSGLLNENNGPAGSRPTILGNFPVRKFLPAESQMVPIKWFFNSIVIYPNAIPIPAMCAPKLNPITIKSDRFNILFSTLNDSHIWNRSKENKKMNEVSKHTINGVSFELTKFSSHAFKTKMCC